MEQQEDRKRASRDEVELPELPEIGEVAASTATFLRSMVRGAVRGATAAVLAVIEEGRRGYIEGREQYKERAAEKAAAREKE